VRTTIKLDDDLLTEAKSTAARTGQTLASVIEDAVRESFARRGRSPVRQASPEIPVFGHGGLRPGVDLDDTAALLDVMDGTDR
jgi:hypothetical protein